MIDNVFQNLANAIIIQAAKDYRIVIRMLAKNPQHSRAMEEKKELEDFFLSEWFKTLSGVNGEILLKKLEQEVRHDSKRAF